MVNVMGLLAGAGVALLVLMPLALKWQLPLRIVSTWAVLLGSFSGLVWQSVFSEEALSWRWLAAHVVTVLATSSVAAAAAFFRDPDRAAPEVPGAILSPADGKVVYVRRFASGERPPIEKKGKALDLREMAQVEVGESCHLVGIGMHLLNVHVNRAPVAGRVTSLVHTPGLFVSLRRDGATMMNERFTTAIAGERVKVVVVQIASRLVRRIVSYLALDEDVAVGQRIGMIKFGSQVDVIIPDSELLELRVQPGDLVRAGVTVLGVIGDDEQRPE